MTGSARASEIVADGIGKRFGRFIALQYISLKVARGQFLTLLGRATGITFVFVTYDQTEALALSARVAIFDRGKVQQIATPSDRLYRGQAGGRSFPAASLASLSMFFRRMCMF